MAEEPSPAGPLIASMLAERLRWVRTTPFGTAVDPEVNCTSAMSSSDGVWSGSSGGASSVSRDSTTSMLGQLARMSSNC